MPARNKITKEHYETLAEFRYALRKFLRFSENAARSAGLTPQQHQAMLAIKGFPGRDRVNIGELADRLQIKHHSAVGLVDRLVTERFVRREPDEKDRRHVNLTLTSRGEVALEKISTMNREQLRRMAPELTRFLATLNAARV
jgi:DNA-binding MarR family transcriptional regulator